jgi:hypothetical protein
MTRQSSDWPAQYRVWIAAYRNWTPRSCCDVPSHGVALEPAEMDTMSASQAARYVEAFNRAALAQDRKIWAVAILITVRYDGEPRRGQLLTKAAVEFAPASGEESPPFVAHASRCDRHSQPQDST